MDDFYEGQGRLDGYHCDYTEYDKLKFLNHIHDEFNIKNIEMEANAFIGYCSRANIKHAVCNVTLLDRLQGDQVTTPPHIMNGWKHRSMAIVARYVEKNLRK